MLGKGWFPAQTGGLDRYFTHLARELAADSAVVVTPVVIGPAVDGSVGVIACACHDAGLWRRIVAFFRHCQALVADVADVHFALYGAMPVVAGRLRRLPLVVHFHGPWAMESSGTRASRFVKRLIELSVYRRADRCITLTKAFADLLVDEYGVDPDRVYVEPPGVDADWFSPGDRSRARARLGVDSGDFVACCVRRLVGRMGIDVLFEAWASLVSVNTPGTLLIAGDGPLRSELERRAAELEISKSVRFLGRVSDADLVDVYRAADVNVVPSVELEGFGLVVLEAAACGTPSVVTDVGGLPEAVQALDSSLVVPRDSPSALARRLRKPLPSREETALFARGLSWQAVADRDIAHLRAVATEHP